MKARIGNLEILHSQMFLIPEGKEAWVEFKALSWDVKLKFVLEKDEENPDKGSFNIAGNNDHGVITLKNWSSSLGMSLQEPIDFGLTEGKKVYFMAFGHKVGSVTKLDVQFYMECGNE